MSVPAALLTKLRLRRQASFAGTCTVSRKTLAQDESGQAVVSWTTVFTGPCGLVVQNAAKRPLVAGLAQQVDARLHLPVAGGFQPQAGDRVDMLSIYGLPAPGEHYEIVHVVPQLLSYRCDVRRMEPQA